MAGRRNTYWVGYTYKYELWDSIDKVWEEIDDSEADRFHCLKKDIKKEVEKRIKEDLQYETYRNLTFDIYESYITTDSEV